MFAERNRSKGNQMNIQDLEIGQIVKDKPIHTYKKVQYTYEIVGFTKKRVKVLLVAIGASKPTKPNFIWAISANSIIEIVKGAN